MQTRCFMRPFGIALMGLALWLTAASSKEPPRLTLLFSSDEYGYLEPCG